MRVAALRWRIGERVTILFYFEVSIFECDTAEVKAA